MRWIVIAVAATTLSACTTEEARHYQDLPGYAYRTDPACKRTEAPSEFDERCDCPRLGFEGFDPLTACAIN
jgi:hypothetical protein